MALLDSKKLRWITLVLSSLVLLSSTSFAEDTQLVDSLKILIGTLKDDTVKVSVLNDLGWELMYVDPDTSIVLGKQALVLSEKLKAEQFRANSLSRLGAYYFVKSEFTTALNYHLEALDIRLERNDKQGLTISYSHIGLIYWHQADYNTAGEYYAKSLAIETELGDKLGMASSYNNIALIYTNQADYPRALEEHFKALKIKEELSNSPDEAMAERARESMAYTYTNIGIVYQYQTEYKTSHDYFSKAASIYEETGNKMGMSRAYNNIGTNYLHQKESRLALEYYYKALKLKRELGHKKGLAKCFTNIGSLLSSLYEEQESSAEVRDALSISWAIENPARLLDTALYYQQKSLLISRELRDAHEVAYSLYGLGNIYGMQGKYNLAIDHYQEAVLLADSTGALHMESAAHSELTTCYELVGNHKLALEHYKVHTALKDSMFNEEKSKDLGKLEAKHEMEMAEQEQKRLEEEKTKSETESKSRRDNLQYSGILIFLVVLGSGLLALGRFAIPVRLAEGMIFFSFLLFFEFTLVLLDPYIEQYSSGAPAIKLGFNALLAAMIFPLHSLFENKLKGRLLK